MSIDKSEKKEYELHSLQNIFGTSLEKISYLNKLNSEDLLSLKNLILETIQNWQKDIFVTIAKVSRFMPNFLNAKVSHDILGPQITANLSYYLSAKEAIAIASHFTTSFFADVVEHLVPEKISEMIAITPFEQMRKVVNELILRKNFFIIGSLIDYTPLSSVEKIAKGIPDPGHLILITYNCQDKLRVLKLFQNFGEQRVREVIQAGLENDYYMQLKSIYEHADSSLLEFSITSLAKEESVLLKFKQMIKS
ncbi:MAG: hypothetical protein O9346_17010 [Leptospiraceae bacterium]|nr:hypothetical protein [Leptospiraceae bacterium]MCZ8348114.1 hypothetical protein [Leptospiraceae bacterium]